MKTLSDKKKTAVNEASKVEINKETGLSVGNGSDANEIIIADKGQAISVNKEDAAKLIEALKKMI